MERKEISQKVLLIFNQLNVPELNKAGLTVEECNPSDPHVRISKGSEVLYRIYNESKEVVGFSTSMVNPTADKIIRGRKIPVDYHQLSEGWYRFLHNLPDFANVKQNYQKISFEQFLE